MSDERQQLLEKSARWAEAIIEQAHTVFTKLAKQQVPECFWIGCGIKDGIWNNLNVTGSGLGQLPPQYRLRTSWLA
ncbi:hypothetical protein [Stutzerimonas zhaodongensis]|uniref:hypothetical protein n=1 Tax=Stutzerimonas TaxID=2901164 RepID=UPI0038902568